MIKLLILNFNRILIITILSMVTLSNYAQNLVPNPSFENYSSCPTSASQIYFAIPWNGVTTNSTDYFNSCNTDVRSVPRCGAGWQYARNGGAYAAIWVINGWGSNYREYLRVQLTTALVQDSCYWVQFYCNVYNLSCFGINKLAACLTNTAINTVGPGLVLQTSPQIISNQLLSDTLNWMKVSGYYKALGGEQYLTIGNFNTDVTTDTMNVRGNGCSGSYYLIDDVSITKIPACDTLNPSLSVIEQKQDYRFKLYPNPNNGEVKLEYTLKQNEKGIFILYDVTGKRIDQLILNSETTSINLNENSLQAGIYFYTVSVNSKPVKTEKLVIIK
jgi:hypothetical protein